MEPDWQNSFWGSNYGRLAELKSRYDPNMVFWVTPGINADHMKVVDKRLCKTTPPVPAALVAPKTDNQKVAEVSVLIERFGKSERNADFPPPGKFVGLQS